MCAIQLMCVIYLQVPVYGTLVGLVNVDLPEFGRKVINAVHEQLENASKIDDFLVRPSTNRKQAEHTQIGRETRRDRQKNTHADL